MKNLETQQVPGTEFGYPDTFGDATVTYCNDNPITIAFANGVVEARMYRRDKVYRSLIDENGLFTNIVD